MKVALVSEGTYPYTMGGVSVWCEQLIRGFPDYRWEVVALAVDGSEPSVFARPDNLERINPIPLWGPEPDGHARPGTEFWPPYESFLAAVLSPPGSGPERAPPVIESPT